MKHLFFIGLVMLSFNTSAFPQDTMCEDRYPQLCRSTLTYSCSGPSISGTVKITPKDRVTGKPGGYGIAYSLVANLEVAGRSYVLRGTGLVKYKHRYLDSYGSWEPNYDIWMYNMFGAQAAFNPNHTPMYLEVSHGGTRGIRGYLSYWADYRTEPDPRFSFSCSRL